MKKPFFYLAVVILVVSLVAGSLALGGCKAKKPSGKSTKPPTTVPGY